MQYEIKFQLFFEILDKFKFKQNLAQRNRQ
jgi:hypothetical protein